jgi:X-X-X-Leu-X-X-Gly heptad repeat protein
MDTNNDITALTEGSSALTEGSSALTEGSSALTTKTKAELLAICEQYKLTKCKSKTKTELIELINGLSPPLTSIPVTLTPKNTPIKGGVKGEPVVPLTPKGT